MQAFVLLKTLYFAAISLQLYGATFHHYWVYVVTDCLFCVGPVLHKNLVYDRV
jgi:hypothetical protein